MSKRASVEVIVIDQDDEDIRTDLNSDASHFRGPIVKTNATAAKNKCKEFRNTISKPIFIKLTGKGKERKEYLRNISITSITRELPPGTHLYRDRLSGSSSWCIYPAYISFKILT